MRRTRFAISKRVVTVAAAWAAALMIGAMVQGRASESDVGLLMGCVGLLPLFFAVRFLRPWQALFAGLIWGGFLWLFGHAGATTFATGPFTALLLYACLPGLFCLSSAALVRRLGFHPLVIGVGWMALELCLAPLGSGHGLVSGASLTGTVFYALGKLFGYVLVAFVIAFVAAVVVDAVGRALDWEDRSKYVRRADDVVPLSWVNVVPHFLRETPCSSNPRAPPVRAFAVTIP